MRFKFQRQGWRARISSTMRRRSSARTIRDRFPKTEACACEGCRPACRKRPGWFLPDEVQPLAAAMGLTLQELFDRHLAVNWWKPDGRLPVTTFVLAPAIRSSPPGEEYPGDRRGWCRWYGDDGRCAVHDLGKPFECAAARHDVPSGDRHLSIAREWVAHQGMIKTLLGREPVESSGTSLFDMLGYPPV